MKITEETITELFSSKFIRIFDLLKEEGKHYYNATRRTADRLPALKSDEEFRSMTPDAVTVCLIVKTEDEPERLLMQREFRYPCGRFILCPPAGLIDPQDYGKSDAALNAAKREVFEETGIRVKDSDRAEIINPLLFSSPGMTDESNALACITVTLDDLSVLNNSGTEEMEMFDGFVLVDAEQAKQLIMNGCDENGLYYSTYTWTCLMWFVSGFWKH
ncbi:MAG: NUDIX hydrolase [Solobacterium sp.]|nr:NUDIX hydrolase [Solobacterium sp.]